MIRVVAVLLLGLCLITAGCIGILDQGSNESTQQSIEQTVPSTDSNRDTPVENGETKSEKGTLSDQEREYINSGQAYAALVGEELERHEQTRLTSSQARPNNTIDLTIQLRGERSVYWSMMDGVRSISSVTFHATSETQNLPRDNGTIQRLYMPERVFVDIRGLEGKLIGTFTVDPEMARRYRLQRVQETEFANTVVQSYDSSRDYELGDVQPSHYLNRSELTIWARDYVEVIQNSTEESFDKSFPVDNLQTNSSSHEILHEFNWSNGEYGQATVSASSAVYGSYWRTTDQSWAMAPERLNVYIHRPKGEEDYAGYMDRQWVYALLDTNRDSANLTAYMDREEGQYVNEDENPFEDDF